MATVSGLVFSCIVFFFSVLGVFKRPLVYEKHGSRAAQEMNVFGSTGNGGT